MKTEIFVDILMAAGYWGGVENVINRLGLYLKRQGFVVRIVQLIYEGDRWIDDELEFVYYFDSRLNMDLEKMYQGYKEILEKSHRKPDIILATNWPYMCYLGKRATQELDFDAPVIGYPHTNPWRFEVAGYGSIQMLDYADICFAISDMIKDDILKANPEAFVYRVNNPLPEGIKPSEIKNKNPLHLAYVGRLNEEKKPDLLIEAIGVCKYPYHLYLVGHGPMLSSLKKRAKELGINERVHFLGWKDSPWDAVSSSSICVMASEYEGFSLSATEAMARGMSLISTPVSGSIELIKPGITGYLFEHGKYEELADILDKIAEGILPMISSEACIEIAIPFKTNIALFDTAVKLYAAANHRYLAYSDVRIQKLSIVVPIKEMIADLEVYLESIFAQSLGEDMMEIILVDANKSQEASKLLVEIERSHPDSVMIINCQPNEKIDYCEVGLFYVGGAYTCIFNPNRNLQKTELSSLLFNAITYRKEPHLGII